MLLTSAIIYLFLYLQSSRTIGFATITSRFEQIVFKRIYCRLLFQEIYVLARMFT